MIKIWKDLRNWNVNIIHQNVGKISSKTGKLFFLEIWKMYFQYIVNVVYKHYYWYIWYWCTAKLFITVTLRSCFEVACDFWFQNFGNNIKMDAIFLNFELWQPFQHFITNIYKIYLFCLKIKISSHFWNNLCRNILVYDGQNFRDR